MLKKILSFLFGAYKENASIIIKFLGIKFKFRYPVVNQLEEVCCIQGLENIKKNNTYFPHPIGIVIHPKVKIGKNCTIFQNVTIGDGKFNLERNTSIPEIGDNVTICANAVVIGGIRVGNNAVIGAGAVVLKDVPENAVVAGNPAKIIKYKNR